MDGAPGAGVEILDLHRLHPVLAVDPSHAGPGGDGDVEGEAPGVAERGVGLAGGVGAGHQDGLAAGLTRGKDGGPADQLGGAPDPRRAEGDMRSPLSAELAAARMPAGFRYRDPGSATYTSCSHPVGLPPDGPILAGWLVAEVAQLGA